MDAKKIMKIFDETAFVRMGGSMEEFKTAEYLKKLCAEKGMNYMGAAEIVMPENYIALFDAPSINATKKIIKEALPSILEAKTNF